MRKTSVLIVSVAIAAGVIAAAPSRAFACYCEAWSNDGWGWAYANSCTEASQVALSACAEITSRFDYCEVTFCSPDH
jgi:hypothetical protein